MFNLGFWEMAVLAVFALVFVGPERLPGMARSIGRFLNDLKRTTNTITSEINAQMDEESFSKEKTTKSPKKVTSKDSKPSKETDHEPVS